MTSAFEWPSWPARRVLLSLTTEFFGIEIVDGELERLGKIHAVSFEGLVNDASNCLFKIGRTTGGLVPVVGGNLTEETR